MEQWKTINDFPNYKISNLGNVINSETKKMLKITINNKGYYVVYLCGENYKTVIKTIHRLIAIHFIDNPNNLPCVNHIDGDKLNNCIVNLEWCTYSHNNQHAWDNELQSTKHILQLDMRGNLIQEYQNALQASRASGAKQSNIIKCCQNEYGYKTAKGFKWQYK